MHSKREGETSDRREGELPIKESGQMPEGGQR